MRKNRVVVLNFFTEARLVNCAIFTNLQPLGRDALKFADAVSFMSRAKKKLFFPSLFGESTAALETANVCFSNNIISEHESKLYGRSQEFCRSINNNK